MSNMMRTLRADRLRAGDRTIGIYVDVLVEKIDFALYQTRISHFSDSTNGARPMPFGEQ
jgi:hypothetical protein